MPTRIRHSPRPGASVIGIAGSIAMRDQARQRPVQHIHEIASSAIPTAMAPAGMSGPYHGATPSHGVTESTLSPVFSTAPLVQSDTSLAAPVAPLPASSAAVPAQSTTPSLK